MNVNDILKTKDLDPGMEIREFTLKLYTCRRMLHLHPLNFELSIKTSCSPGRHQIKELRWKKLCRNKISPKRSNYSDM